MVEEVHRPKGVSGGDEEGGWGRGRGLEGVCGEFFTSDSHSRFSLDILMLLPIRTLSGVMGVLGVSGV